MTRPFRTAVISVTALALLAACNDDLLDPPLDLGTPGSPGFLRAVGWVEVVGAVSDTLHLAVRAYDHQGVLAGVPILWLVAEDGISMSPASTTTDSDGIASATVTLGPGEGQWMISAWAPTLGDAPQVTFSATAVTAIVDAKDSLDGGFTPSMVTVSPGGTVVWHWDSAEGDVHDVTFDDGVSSGSLWLGSLGGREYYTRVFDDPPRTARYRCSYHSSSDFTDGEVGTVVVEP